MVHLGTTIRLQLLDKALKETDGKVVLDAGCGYGFGSRYLLKNGYQVTGIDKNEGRLRWARFLAKGADIQKGDIYHLPFAKGSFDGAVCLEVLEHLKDDSGAVREIARVIKKGGWMVVSFPGKADTEKVFKELGHVRIGYSPSEAGELASMNGFKLVKGWSYGNTWWGQTVLEINYFLGGMAGFLNGIMKEDERRIPKGEVSGRVMLWKRN